MSELSDDYRRIRQLRADDRAKKEPQRMRFAIDQLMKAGARVTGISDQTVTVNGYITLWPFTGWWSGKGIGSGRGIRNLIKKLGVQND